MSLSSIPQRALVVGGTSGIGQGIALALAKRDCEVIVVGRSAQRGNEIVQQLSALSPQKSHSFQSIDAFDLKSVKDIADRNDKKIDFLVLTHGMATIQGYTPTVNGIDQKLQLHYFSRIYLAKLMAPHMEEGSRILTVLSAGVHSKYNQFEDDFELKGTYSTKNAADAAGYYTDAGFERLSEEYPGLVVAHACPGFVNTNWGTEFPWMLRMAIRPIQSFFARTLEDCGEFMTQGCLDLSTKGFHLLDQDGKTFTGGIKHSPEDRDVIWERTLKLLPDL